MRYKIVRRVAWIDELDKKNCKIYAIKTRIVPRFASICS